MRSPRILALALVAAALTTAPANAAGETCRGQAATIVGEPHGDVTGTPGDDVIVTNGATGVDALAGDDVVCVTAINGGSVEIYAGPGADIVDTTAVWTAAYSVLGVGRDRLYGGPGIDSVTTGSIRADREIDRVQAGGGHDSVETGEPGQVDADDVDLGNGPGVLSLLSDRTTGVLRAAPGATATLELRPAAPGDWVIDDRTGRATLDGRTMTRWASLRVAEVDGSRQARLHFVGRDRSDYLYVSGNLRGVDLGRGADFVGLRPGNRIGGSFLGGPGRDELEILSAEVLADLDRGRFGTDLDKATARIAGFENLDVRATDTRLTGDTEPNVLRVSGCRAVLHGGGGDDNLVMLGPTRGCDPDARGAWEYGGAGNDKLRGTAFADHLLGGAGRDRAVGRSGNDVCRAERQVECEA